MSDDTSYAVIADELRQFVEQFEQLESEKKDASDRQKEVVAELKARGYDATAFRVIIALRKKDPDKRQEQDAIVDLYKGALNMA